MWRYSSYPAWDFLLLRKRAVSSASVHRHGSSMLRGGAFQAGRNDLSVRGEVDEFELEKFGFVVQQVDRWPLGRLTTLSRNGRVRGDGLLLIHGHT
jgi:hypothetical protein